MGDTHMAQHPLVRTLLAVSLAGIITAGTSAAPAGSAPSGSETTATTTTAVTSVPPPTTETAGTPDPHPPAPTTTAVAGEPEPAVSGTGGRAPSAETTRLTVGHVDIIAVRPDGAELTLAVKDDSAGPPVWRSPSAVTFFVPDSAAVAVPADPSFAFLGTPGATVWVLPQVQRADLLWPGWSTEEIPSGFLTPNSVRWRLLEVRGPGRFALFTTNSFGSPDVIFNSADGLPDELVLPAGIHGHGNWVFSAKGTYDLVFEIAGNLTSGGPRIVRATYRFDVVEATTTEPVPPPSIDAPADPIPLPADDGSGSANPGNEAASTITASRSPAAASGTTGAAAGSRGAGGTDPLPPTGAENAWLALAGAALIAAGTGLARWSAARRCRAGRATEFVSADGSRLSEGSRPPGQAQVRS